MGVDCTIKWPNDIYVRRKKICGILIENSFRGEEVAASVIGVGLNINQRTFPQLANATSLVLCSGREEKLEDCLDAVTALFEEKLPALFQAGPRSRLFDAYSARLFQKGVKASYRDMLSGREFTGVIEGVEPDGRLRLRDEDAKRLQFYRFKEVSYIL